MFSLTIPLVQPIQLFFNSKKRRFEELLVLMDPGSTKENASITLVYADVPRQQNM